MPNLPSLSAFLEDDVLDPDWNAVDWLTMGIPPVLDGEGDLISFA